MWHVNCKPHLECLVMFCFHQPMGIHILSTGCSFIHSPQHACIFLPFITNVFFSINLCGIHERVYILFIVQSCCKSNVGKNICKNYPFYLGKSAHVHSLRRAAILLHCFGHNFSSLFPKYCCSNFFLMSSMGC